MPNRRRLAVGGRRSPRRRLLLLHSLLLLTLASALLHRPVLGWTAPAGARLEGARAALQGARQGAAARWAPLALARAERLYVDAAAEHRRQELRPLPARDFRLARRALEVAAEAAAEATRQAAAARSSATALAAGSVAEADAALEILWAAVEALRVTSRDRARAHRAAVAAGEARSLLREDPERARQRAEWASAEARQLMEPLAGQAARFTDAALLDTWHRWVEETLAWSARNDAAAIVVLKEDHLLTLYQAGRAVRSYPADIGANPGAQKRRSGDRATPEGRYRITARKGPGATQYHKALLLDYPNQQDRQRFEAARRAGDLPPGATPGGLIEVHGDGGRGVDWTDGCIALSNPDMDHLFARVRVGTPVTIVGGSGSGGAFSSIAERYRRRTGGGFR